MMEIYVSVLLRVEEDSECLSVLVLLTEYVVRLVDDYKLYRLWPIFLCSSNPFISIECRLFI